MVERQRPRMARCPWFIMRHGHWWAGSGLSRAALTLLVGLAGTPMALADPGAVAVAVADAASAAAPARGRSHFSTSPRAAVTEASMRYATFDTPTVDAASIAPPQTLAQSEDGMCQASAAGAGWQATVGDALLDAVITLALRDNLGLKEQDARLDQAKAHSRAAGAARGPQADAYLRYDHYTSLSSVDDRWRRNRPEFKAGLTITQDLDFWGRLRDKQRVAQLLEAQARFARDDARRRLMLAVVKTYWEVAYLRESGAWLKALQDIARTRVIVMEARYRNGDVRGDDLFVARADASDRDIEWATLVSRANKAVHELARLTGQAPGVHDSLAVLPQRPTGLPVRMDKMTAMLPASSGRHSDARLPETLPEISADLSARQLQCRADIRASAAALSAFAAETAVIRKDWYPHISLTAGLNTGSPSLLSLVNAPLAVLAGMIKLPFLNPGQRHRITEAEARYDLAEMRYLQQWQIALKEVADALADRAQASRAWQQEVSRRADLMAVERIAEQRYRAGEIATVDWLDRQEQRMRVEMALLAANRDRAMSVIQLIQSLGGSASYVPLYKD